jgi:peptidyl-prolyl cis-trans isomerase D
MKKVVLVLLLVVFSVLAFSEIVGYLTKDGKVLENYSLDDKRFEIEYLNRINSMQQSGQKFDKSKEPYYMLSTIRDILNYKILEYYAKENGYTPDATKIDQQTKDLMSQYLNNPKTKDQIINYFGSEENFEKYIRENLEASEYYYYVDSKIGNVTEDELNDYIKNNIDDIKLRYEKILTKHILVTDEATANKILNEIKSGKITFEDAAKKYSIDTQSAKNGGSIDWVAKNQVVPEYFDAAFKANVGDIVGPVKSNYGYHIIKVEGKKVYNNVNDIKADKDLVAKLRTELKNEKLSKWYSEYSKNFDYALKYEPLIYEDRIEKAKTLKEKIDIEKKLYDAIRSNPNAPELWQESYLNLVQELNQTLPEVIEVNRIISKYKDTKYLSMTEDEISNKIDELESAIAKEKDEKTKSEKTTLKKDLEELYYAKIMYPDLLKNNDFSSEYIQKYSEELKTREFNMLKDKYNKNKDMDTLIKLYQLNPDDPQISFEYNYTYYQYIKQYISSQPKDVIQPELEKMLQAFEKIVSTTDDEKIKTESQKIIDEIKTTLKNMMGDNN